MFEKEVKIEHLPQKHFNNKTFIILQSNPNTYTHGFFKYPCRFIPEIPRWAIKCFTNKGDIVFDPFAGSGTSLLEAVINNRPAFGTEIDDIAKLIIKAKSLKLSNQEFQDLRNLWDELNNYVNNETSREFRPQINNLEHWFSKKNIHELGKISCFIKEIKNENLKCFYDICLASIIKKCSFCDDMSPKPYVSSRIKKKENQAIIEFNIIFNKYLTMLENYNKLNISEKIEIVHGDALHFNLNNKINLAITSPPYINAFDYVRTMRLENLWIGGKDENDLKISKKNYVGTEQIIVNNEVKNLNILNDSKILNNCFNKILNIDRKRAFIVKKFFDDMKTNLEIVYKHLEDNGYYVIVIGNSSIRKVKIESWKILKDIAIKIGYSFDSAFRYVIKNPYIRIPRNGRGGIVNYDYVLCLKKEK